MKSLENIYKLILIDPTDPKAYLWTRNGILRPFDLEYFMSLKGDKIKILFQILPFFSLSVQNIHIFYQLIQSGIYDFKASRPISESLQFSILKNPFHSNMLNIILYETSVNMFVISHLGK